MADPTTQTAQAGAAAAARTRESELTDEMRRDFDALRRDVSSLTEVVKQYAQLQESNLKTMANDRIVSLKAAGEDQIEHLRSRAEQTVRDAEGYVRQNPTNAVAGAAALGFIIGAIFSRR